MAWKISKAKRQALVKLQLRDKKGRWIEMGGGVKWYSSRLKKQVSGTVVGTKGNNALVRLNKENPTHEPALVSVPARNITVVDSKASLAPASKPGTPTDKTSAFERPIAVANEANGAPKSNGYVKPSDSPEDWNVSVTSDGRAYVGRKDGAELYFPARSLEVGDVLVAPEGGDETKPFSIGKGWAKKGVESVNTKGPKTGTVLRIEGDRYAVVQLPDGFTVEDKKNPGEQTDLITVGLSNSVIKLTDGMKSALGEHITDTFDGNADEQEVDDSEEEQSDHVGREVPEEEAAAEEADPADVDLTDITDGEEVEKDAPITERAREIEVDNSGSDDQTLNENGLTDDEQKMVKAYDRMAQRAYDQGNIENGDKYSANANKLRKAGEDRRAGAVADPVNTSDTPVKDPQNAPEAAPEAPEAAKTNVSLDDLEKQAKADGDTVLYHGGLPEGTTLDDIDLNRNGSQQNKRGRSFGGFYLTDESSKSWSDDYAMKRNGVMHGFAIDKNARIDDRGSEQIDRLSAEDRAEASKHADVIKGKDLLGRTQYVILNKDAVKGVGETNLKDDKSSENSAPVEDAPQPVSDAEKQYDAIKAEVRAARYPGEDIEPDLDDPRIKAAEDAEQNAYDSVSQGQVTEYTPEWFEIWNSTYHDSLETQKSEAAERDRQAEQDAESARLEAEDTAEAPNLEEPDAPAKISAKELLPKNSLATLKKTGRQRQIIAVGDFFGDGKERVYSKNLKNGAPFGKTYTNFPEEFETPEVDPYRPTDLKPLNREGLYAYGADYETKTFGADDAARLPIGTMIYGNEEDDETYLKKYHKIADNQWIGDDDRIFTDADMSEGYWSQSIFLPNNENNKIDQDTIDSLFKRYGKKDTQKEETAPESAQEPETTPEPTPEPEAAPEAAPEDDEEDIPGDGKPTLYSTTVRGHTKDELEFFDETARTSGVDQGYRMSGSRIEVYDFDKADSAMDNGIDVWEDHLEGAWEREEKSKAKAVLKGLAALREKIASEKKDLDSLEEPLNIGGKGQQSEHESQMNELGEGEKIAFTDADGNSRTYVKNSEGLFDEIDENMEPVDDDLPAADLAWQHRMDTPSVDTTDDIESEEEESEAEADGAEAAPEESSEEAPEESPEPKEDDSVVHPPRPENWHTHLSTYTKAEVYDEYPTGSVVTGNAGKALGHSFVKQDDGTWEHTSPNGAKETLDGRGMEATVGPWKYNTNSGYTAISGPDYKGDRMADVWKSGELEHSEPLAPGHHSNVFFEARLGRDIPVGGTATPHIPEHSGYAHKTYDGVEFKKITPTTWEGVDNNGKASTMDDSGLARFSIDNQAKFDVHKPSERPEEFMPNYSEEFGDSPFGNGYRRLSNTKDSELYSLRTSKDGLSGSSLHLGDKVVLNDGTRGSYAGFSTKGFKFKPENSKRKTPLDVSAKDIAEAWRPEKHIITSDPANNTFGDDFGPVHFDYWKPAQGQFKRGDKINFGNKKVDGTVIEIDGKKGVRVSRDASKNARQTDWIDYTQINSVYRKGLPNVPYEEPQDESKAEDSTEAPAAEVVNVTPETPQDAADAPIVSRYAGQAKGTLTKALEGNPDSGIELDGEKANVSDIDKAQDFLRDLVGDIQAKIDDPTAGKASKVQDNKIIRDLRALLNDVNAKQIARDGSPRPNKALRGETTEETPEATPEAPAYNERGLTEAEEEQYEQHLIDADVEARAGDDYGVQEYRDKAEAILQTGQKRLSGEEESSESDFGYEVYTEGGQGRVPAFKATIQAIRDSGVESVHVPLSDATKKDWTADELEWRFDRDEKKDTFNPYFDRIPAEYKRFKDQSAPADPINLPEDEVEATPAPTPRNPVADLKPTPEQQEKLDELDSQLEEAHKAEDVDAYVQIVDDKAALIDEIKENNPYETLKVSPEDQEALSDARQRMADAVSSGDQEAGDEAAAEYIQLMEDVDKKNRGVYVEEDDSDEDVNPLDALDITRRTPEAISGEDYAPTQQQQDVIDAVLAGLDTKVQAMAGTGKTSTLVALSRRLTGIGKQAVYIAFNSTVAEEARSRMDDKGLMVESKTGHSVAHAWAKKNMPHLTIRLNGQDPTQPVKFDKKNNPTGWADKFAITQAKEIARVLGMGKDEIGEEGSGIPLPLGTAVLAIKKTVGSFALSDKDEIGIEHVPESFEISEKSKPKVVEYAKKYWEDLSSEDGSFRMEHDFYRKHWALSRPDLTDGSGGNKRGASVLYIDEAQDTPPVLAKVVADQKMQKVIVGDRNQAIYAFAENIDYLSIADADVELPLDKSWRFGPEVADAGNRFLYMLDTDARVVGGGGPSKITYGMEDADAVLVRTNAGMIHAILEETKRDRKVSAPDGTRSQLTQMANNVADLMEGKAPDNPADDLIGFRNWDEVMSALDAGDRSVSKIVSMFDETSPTARGMIKNYDEFRANQMDNVRKAIDSLVQYVPKFETLKMVKEGNRTYLEPADDLPANKREYAAYEFSVELGKIKKPWAAKKSMPFGEQKKAYFEEGIKTEGWKFDTRSKRWYHTDPDAIRKFEGYSGESDVQVLTAHKSKGLEWDRVRIGDDFFVPYEDKNGATVWPEDSEGEFKLGYVALTRAAKELDPGVLGYVFDEQYVPKDITPKKKRKEDTTPEPEQAEEAAPVVEQAPEPETPEEAPVVEELPEVAPEAEPVVESTPEPEPEVVPEPEVAPEPEAPAPSGNIDDYDPITGLTPEEEARKDQLLKESREAHRNGELFRGNKLHREAQGMFDMGHKRMKELKKAQKQESPAPEVAPEPVVNPTPGIAPAPQFDDEGLTPQERRRLNELERWISEVYKGNGQGNVVKMENEVNDMLERGTRRLNGEPNAEEPIDVTPEFETPAGVADAPAVDETPSPVDEVPVAAPVAPKPKSAPTGRKRGQSTVPDAGGNEIRVGDTVTHKKHGPVTVTGVLPGAGRINFIDPKSGKESSVKGDAVALVNADSPTVEAPVEAVTGTPGDRLVDPVTGKKAFIGGDGVMIVTGERVKDTKTGEVGIVQTVYTGADKKASVPVLFPGNSEPRRVRGTVLVHASTGGSEAPETAPLIPEAPEPAPEAPKAPEEPEPTPEAPKAPEPAPAPAVDEEKMARRRAAIGNAIDGSEVRSKDGSEVYTKLTANFWENADQTDSFTDDEVMDRILNGERDGKGYVIRTPNPAPEPEPTPAPEPTPEPEVVPEPEAPLSGQALADTLTYESTLHMSDGDLAEMMSRYADDAIVFDKIMEIMDERDANVFLEVDTSKTGATFEDQPALFDVPEPVAKAAAKPQRNLTPQQKASEEYQHYVMSQYNKALEDLNGVLLNDAGKAHARGAGGTDLEINIFSGSASIARKYASEELLQWWLENGRETLGSFRFGMYGWDNDRKAAQTVRNLGYKRGQTAHDRSNA